VPIYLLLHGARVDETPSARGSIADQSMISGRFSTEQFFLFFLVRNHSTEQAIGAICWVLG